MAPPAMYMYIALSDLLSEFNTRHGRPVAKLASKMTHCRRVLELPTEQPSKR